jgi:hypothetical protein
VNPIDEALQLIFKTLKNDPGIQSILGGDAYKYVYNTNNIAAVFQEKEPFYPHCNLFPSSTYVFGQEVRRFDITINSRDKSVGDVGQSRDLAFAVCSALNEKNLFGVDVRYFTKASVLPDINEDENITNVPVNIGVDVIGGD